MKKSIIFSLFAAALFAACDPIEDRDSIGGAITADQLDVTATPIVVNGKNGNMVVVHSKSPVLSSWTVGTATTLSANDTVMVTSTGDLPVTYTGLNPDGSKVTKTWTITVDTLSTLPELYKFLFGDPGAGVTAKKYIWKDNIEAVWGNGGYIGCYAPAWWKVSKAEMDGQDAVYGKDGYMIFDLNGMKLTRSTADGTTTETGTADLNLTYVTSGYAKAKLLTKNNTVLKGVAPNGGNAPIYEYQILTLDEDEMVLCWPEGGDAAGAWSTAWFWMFSSTNYNN